MNPVSRLGHKPNTQITISLTGWHHECGSNSVIKILTIFALALIVNCTVLSNVLVGTRNRECLSLAM